MKNNPIERLSKQQLRKFGLSFAAFLVIFMGLLLPWLLDIQTPMAIWYSALFFVGWALLAPNTLQSFYQLWMQLALLLNKITSPLLLTLIYILTVVPIGLLMRSVKAKVLKTGFDYKASSYRSSSRPIDKDSFEKPF